MSCRAAAERLGDGPSSAVEWMQLFRNMETVSLAPRKNAHRSIPEAHRDWLLARVAS